MSGSHAISAIQKYIENWQVLENKLNKLNNGSALFHKSL